VASMNFEFLKSITLNDVKSLYTEADWKEKWLFGWPDPILLRLEIFFRSPTDKQSAAASLYISVWILENDNSKDNKSNDWELNHSLQVAIVRRDAAKLAKFLDATAAVELSKATEMT
jgi:hypothetical protein